MTLKVKYQDTDGEDLEWTRAEDDTAADADKVPNTPPPWTVLTDSAHDDDWTLAVGPVVNVDDTPFPARKTVEECETANAVGDMNKAKEIAAWATKATRNMLTQGAFNAVFPLHPDDNPDDAPANFHDADHAPSYLTGEVSPKHLYDISEDMFMDLSVEKLWAGAIVREIVSTLPRDPLVQLLARFYGTVTARGGVCSMMSAVTAAMASLTAYPVEFDGANYTELLICSHGADHSFVVVGYGNSPWIVADPWVAEPYIIPLEDNYFNQDGIKLYQHVCIGKRFTVPFGIPIVQGPWDREALDSDVIEGLDLTKEMLVAAEGDNNALVAPNNSFKHRGAYMGWNADHSSWGALNIRTTSGKNFHTNHVWQHQTNHGSYDPEDLTVWEEFRGNNRPLLKANAWGDDVDMD